MQHQHSNAFIEFRDSHLGHERGKSCRLVYCSHLIHFHRQAIYFVSILVLMCLAVVVSRLAAELSCAISPDGRDEFPCRMKAPCLSVRFAVGGAPCACALASRATLVCSFASFFSLWHVANSIGPMLPDRLQPTCSPPLPLPTYLSGTAFSGSSARRFTRAAASSLMSQVGLHTRWLHVDTGDGAGSRPCRRLLAVVGVLKAVHAIWLRRPAPQIAPCSGLRVPSPAKRKYYVRQGVPIAAQLPMMRSQCCPQRRDATAPIDLTHDAMRELPIHRRALIFHELAASRQVPRPHPAC